MVSLKKPPYNNIEVNYYYDADLVPYGSKSHIRWAASTVNNALHEFHDYAIADGIDTPPDKLNIYLGRNSNSAYALMTKKISPPLVAGAITAGLAISGVEPELSFAILSWPFLLDIFSVSTITLLFFPDVHIGLIGEATSDQLKSLAYHEIAHTSHYSQVGASYWLGLVTAETAAGGHGDATSFDSGRIALVESWAEFIAMTYTHREFPTDDVTSINGTWNTRLERTWNEDSNHIPIGLHHDLVDAAVGSEPALVCNQSGGCTTMVGQRIRIYDQPTLFIPSQ